MMTRIFSLMVFLTTLLSASEEMLIKNGEILRISVGNVPQADQMRLNSYYEVDENGDLIIWKIGKLQAGGKTTNAFETEITARYINAEIFRKLLVKIDNTGAWELGQFSLGITVAGAVLGPGRKPFIEGMTLYDAISAAGGANDQRSLKRVKLYRNAKVYSYGLTTDEHKRVKIYPNDAIEVPSPDELVWHSFRAVNRGGDRWSPCQFSLYVNGWRMEVSATEP